MVVRSQIKVLNRDNLVEIIDGNNVRLFYGKIRELDKFTMALVGGCHIEEVNCFLATISDTDSSVALQIRTEETYPMAKKNKK